MGKGKVNCVNPFDVKSHKTKKATNKITQEVYEALTAQGISFRGQTGDHVCIRCWSKMETSIAQYKDATAREKQDQTCKRKRVSEENVPDATPGPSNPFVSPLVPTTKSARQETIQPSALQLLEGNFTFTTLDSVSGQSVSGGSTSEYSSAFNMQNLNSAVKKLGGPSMNKKDKRVNKIMIRKYVESRKALDNGFKSWTRKSLSRHVTCVNCEQLIADLVERFPQAKTDREKILILTCLPKCVKIPRMLRLFKPYIKPHQAQRASIFREQFGHFYAPESKPVRNTLRPEVRIAVKKFYLDDNNSRVLPGERNTVMDTDDNGDKNRVSKRLILVSLKELFTEFKRENPDMKIGLTSFSKLRPKNCAWPGQDGHHNTCVCVIHENFRVLREVAGDKLKTKDFIRQYLCENTTADCHLGFCAECPDYNKMQTEILKHVTDNVEYHLWQTTDRATLQAFNESPAEYWKRFSESFPKVASHDFIHNKQKDYITGLKNRVKIETSSVVVTVDFGMNYSFIGQNEPQAAHFSRPQCTVHPFVVDGVRNGTPFQKSYVVLSDELNHNSNSFHVFRAKVLKLISRDFPGVKKVFYVSDGSAAQYKNFKNLLNVVHHYDDFGIEIEWHFTATAHGKSTCDAMTAIVKCRTRRESLKEGKIIQNVDQMFAFCKSKWENDPTLEILLVKREEVRQMVSFLEKRYLQVSRLRGIQQIHSFIPIKGTKSVQVRRFSSSAINEVFYPYGAPSGPLASSTQEFPEDTVVAVMIDSSFHLGIVRSVDEDDGMTTIKFMKRRRGTENEFVWPDEAEAKVEVIPSRDILCEAFTIHTLPNGSCALQEDELQRINNMKESHEINASIII